MEGSKIDFATILRGPDAHFGPPPEAGRGGLQGDGETVGGSGQADATADGSEKVLERMQKKALEQVKKGAPKGDKDR